MAVAHPRTFITLKFAHLITIFVLKARGMERVRKTGEGLENAPKKAKE